MLLGLVDHDTAESLLRESITRELCRSRRHGGTMRHPKDRSDGLTRRQLLRGAAGAAAGIGAAGALAACQNTTTPIGFCEDGGEGTVASGGSGLASQLVVPKPVGPGGLPLPRTDNSVTWSITDDNPPIADGLALEDGNAPSLQLPRLHRSGPSQAVPGAVRPQGGGGHL